MNISFDKTDLFKVVAILFMAFNLWQARRVTSETMSHIDKFGDDRHGKSQFAHKILSNFYLFACASLVIIAGILGFLSHEIFLVSFYSILAALGVKLAIESK
jgi:hypothetical protein